MPGQQLLLGVAAGFGAMALASCSSAEDGNTPPVAVGNGQAAESDAYAVENAALDRAMDRTGLPRDASLWIKRTADSAVVCGALARLDGPPVLYLAGRDGGFLGAPLARLEPEVGERMLGQWNRAVMTNCADHGLVPPERVQVLLRPIE